MSKDFEIDLEKIKREGLEFLKNETARAEKRKEKKEQALEKILKENNWTSMNYKKESYNGSKLYEVTTNENEKIDILAFYCKNCGYKIGTPKEQDINHIGFLSSRIGKAYYCDCGELISERINEWG